MDEVLADTLAKELSIYNLEHNANITRDDLAGQNLYQKVRLEHRERVRDYPRTRDFFRDIPVMEGSKEVLRDLVQHHEIFITTAAMEYPTSFTAKYEWIKEHFPFFPDSHIVFCGDKSIIAADFLIDDNAHHFRRFSGKGLLFSAPHNLHEMGFERLNNWFDVRARFLQA
jgi:5'(3')-deoxyribonucleotidase